MLRNRKRDVASFVGIEWRALGHPKLGNRDPAEDSLEAMIRAMCTPFARHASNLQNQPDHPTAGC
jgi:hypothetical protein